MSLTFSIVIYISFSPILLRSTKEKMASFTEPQSPGIPGTPLSFKSSLVGSPGSLDYSPGSSTASSSLTPKLDAVKLGGRRGRPRKLPEPPSYEDFPADGTPEEQQAWMKKKTSEHWHFKKSTGPDAADYRKQESNRALNYYYRKKAEKELGVEQLPQQDSDEKQKELSRAR